MKTPGRLYPDVVTALALVKLAAARAKCEAGQLDRHMLARIEGRCREVIDRTHHDELQFDRVQGGTSVDLNVNAAIANRALGLMRRRQSDRRSHDSRAGSHGSPTTDDTYATAIRVGLALGNRRLVAAVNELIDSLRAKAQEFSSILRIADMAAPDALPLTLGHDFAAFADTLEIDVRALDAVQRALGEVTLGVTATRTDVDLPADYARKCTFHLEHLSGLPISLAPTLADAAQDTEPFVLCSFWLKSLAIKFSKVCHELRLLSCGNGWGLHEIELPAGSPGSSGVPRPLHTVEPDAVVTMIYLGATGKGQANANDTAPPPHFDVFAPVIAVCLFEAQVQFINAAQTLRLHCVDGITANAEVHRRALDRRLGAGASSIPTIGRTRLAES